MKTILFSILAVCSIVYAPMVFGQQYAITESGRRVILHRDGTWEYLQNSGIPKQDLEVKEESGKSARLLIDDEILFVLKDGFLDDFSILSRGPRLYDEMSGKLKQIGSYKIEYDFHTERVKKIGIYSIEYDFHSGRVKKIGPYPIEYDFHSDKISRIGNTQFKYSFFNGKLTEILGHTEGIKITIY